MSVQAYQLYRQTQVSTASQGELLLMLFDGAIRFARQSQEYMRQGELEQRTICSNYIHTFMTFWCRLTLGKRLN